MDANQPAPVAVSLAPTIGFVEMDLADADARFSDTASRTDSRARARAGGALYALDRAVCLDYRRIMIL